MAEQPKRGDLSDPRAIYAKGLLFLILGLLAGALLLVEHFSWQTAVLLCVCVWAFCRAYYCAFYVIQHYVDADYHFSGLIDFCKYCLRRGVHRH
jgi:hypothetical protein